MPDSHEPPELSQRPSIERSVHLDLDADRLWELIATAEGWASWLVDEADVEIAAGQVGSAVDDGRRRSVRVDSVTEGRQVSFSWWDHRDPRSVSRVQLEIVEVADGRSRLHISERFVGAAQGAAATSASRSMARRWEVKLLLLCVMALPALVNA